MTIIKLMIWLEPSMTNSWNQRATKNGLATDHKTKLLNCYFKQGRFITVVNHIMDRNFLYSIGLKQHLWMYTAQNSIQKQYSSTKTQSEMFSSEPLKL